MANEGRGDHEEPGSHNNRNNRRMARVVEWVVIALAVILAVLVVFFVREYLNLRREQILNAREASIDHVLKGHGPLTASDVDIIQPWMTFDYLNRIFVLPADYLQTALPVTDTHYPHLSITSYARDTNEASAAALTNVQTAIKNYFAQEGTGNSSSSATSPSNASLGFPTGAVQGSI
ncbi:MAG TPA: hypothetical protein VHZ04_00085 [Candidatus Paceibacterota bacterium]|jgi:hypothetical protein|nr:hypothetical protein [Candidatus Paceibacterota bacterium]